MITVLWDHQNPVLAGTRRLRPNTSWMAADQQGRVFQAVRPAVIVTPVFLANVITPHDARLFLGGAVDPKTGSFAMVLTDQHVKTVAANVSKRLESQGQRIPRMPSPPRQAVNAPKRTTSSESKSQGLTKEDVGKAAMIVGGALLLDKFAGSFEEHMKNPSRLEEIERNRKEAERLEICNRCGGNGYKGLLENKCFRCGGDGLVQHQFNR